MKKSRYKNIFLYAVGFLCFGAVKSYAVKETTAKFAGKERSFWEKNAENMADVMSYDDFLQIKKTVEERYAAKRKRSPFVLHSFGPRQFYELPASADGSCLWDRLGIPPKKMFNEIITPAINKLSEKCALAPTEECPAEMLEVVDVLDPFDKISKENEAIESRFKKNILYDQLVKENWLEGVEEHGGKALNHNGRLVAFRPPNGDEFFQKIAKYLKVSIVIFSGDDSTLKSTLKVAREFQPGSRDTLYLLDPSGKGLHYSPLIEVGNPVSKAIIAEMKSYLVAEDILKPEQEDSQESGPKKHKPIRKDFLYKK